jgi:hypothetical protein
MKGIMLRVASLTVLLGGLSVVPASAAGHVWIGVNIGVPVAPVVVAPPVVVARPVVVAPPVVPVVVAPVTPVVVAPFPGPGFVWRAGYYVGPRFVPGAWVRRGYVAPVYRYRPRYR